MKAFIVLLFSAAFLVGCGENNVTENETVDDSDRGATMRTGESVEEPAGAETNNAASDR